MNRIKLKAFLDDYQLITVIVSKTYYQHENQLSIYENRRPISFVKQEEIAYDNVYKLTLHIDKEVNLRENWKVTLDESLETEVISGKVVRTKSFIEQYTYLDNDLGAVFHHSQTQFKLWAPIAKKVQLQLFDLTGKKHTHQLEYFRQGVWQVTIKECLEGWGYIYRVYVNGSWKRVNDPYAKSSNANGEINYIIDEEKTFQMKHPPVLVNQPILYEVSVRDFSADPQISFSHPKQYLGMIETELKTVNQTPVGFDYLKQLGITHIQLMPVFDFTGIDELHPERAYNWGYNPHQYFLPEGSYSSNPNDPYLRINELKQLVDTYHKEGLGVIMDVVYNHVDNYQQFPYEILVPGYSFRLDHLDMMTEASGCGNDLYTSRPMIRKLIIDSLVHWTKCYHMDGFRFDLMGLIDVKTMNEAERTLKAINPGVLLYGEGWQMIEDARLAHMNNANVSKTIGFFNDSFRDTVKGSTFNLSDKGYIFGNISYQKQMEDLFLNQHNVPHEQSINYIECHDNHTFYDKAMKILNDPEGARKRQLIATCLTILAPGTPFIHAGQECYRTKAGNGNSYNVSDDINQILWYDVEKHRESIQIVKEFIQFRKQLKHNHFTEIHWFDDGFSYEVEQYVVFVIINEVNIDIPENLHLILTTTKSIQEKKETGIYIYERKSTC